MKKVIKNCKTCDYPLSEFLIMAEADYHITCFPKDEWEKWLDMREPDDKLR